MKRTFVMTVEVDELLGGLHDCEHCKAYDECDDEHKRPRS